MQHGGGIKKLISVINDGQKVRVNAGEWNQRMENHWLLILHGVQLGGEGIKKLNSVMNDGQIVRVHAGEWNHMLKDGKPLVIVTTWSM